MCNLFVGIAVGFENKTELSSKVQSILRQESVCKTVDEVPISILLMWQKISACIGCYVTSYVCLKSNLTTTKNLVQI